MKLKFWLGILISAVCLYFFLRKIDWREVWRIVKSIHYIYLFLCVFLHMVVFLFRAQRWHYLLLPLKKIKISSTFSATVVGFMGNNIFPARLGEIIRAYFIGHREQISKSASLATIVVERLLDAFMVLLVLIALLWFSPFPPGFEQNEVIMTVKFFGWMFAGICCGIILFLLVIKFHLQKFLDWLGKIMLPRFAGAYEKVVDITSSFASGLDGLKRGHHLIRVIGYTVLVWLAIAAAFYAIYPAFELELPIVSVVWLTVVVALAAAVPSSPGYVGPFHLAASTCLSLFGLELNKAKSVALILHGVVFIPVTLLGLWFVYKENLGLKELQALENEA